MSDNETNEAKQRRAEFKAAAQLIDPETAEVMCKHGSMLDPYYLFESIEGDCVGRNYFACNPGSNLWVWFHDLPQAVHDRLWERINAGEFDQEELGPF